MKLFGYATGGTTLLKLQEVTIQADAKRLRSIAVFLNQAADLMEKHGNKFNHEHYSDTVDDLPEDVDVDVIVAR